MKPSKYTQVTSPNGNDFSEYQNRETKASISANDSDIGQTTIGQAEVIQSCKQHTVTNDEQLLSTSVCEREQTIYEMQHLCSEANANKYPTDEEFEMMCNCAIYPNKQKLKQPYSSDQNIASTNRNLCPLTKLDVCENSSQFSSDHKGTQQQAKHRHAYATCDQGQKAMQRIERVPSMKRIQSPEIINIHRGPSTVLYESYDSENCAIKSYGYDKDFKCDDFSFKRGQSFKRTSERSNDSHPRSGKRRPAGDGIDAEMEEPELIFELTEQMRDCQCACDHVIYAPGYTTCLPLIPVSVKLISITDCPINETLPIRTAFLIKNDDDRGAQSIYGNASLDLIIDNQIVMRVLRLKMSPDEGWIPDKIYMRDSSFCKIADNYLRRTTETALGAHLESFCPMHRGSYQFYDFAPDFKGIQFPVEMLGYVKLRIELERLRVDNYSNEQREMVACNEIELASSRPDEDYIEQV